MGQVVNIPGIGVQASQSVQAWPVAPGLAIFAAGGEVAAGAGDLLLLETGSPDNLLLETGDALLLE